MLKIEVDKLLFAGYVANLESFHFMLCIKYCSKKKNYYRPESLSAMFARSAFSMILDTMNSGSLVKSK